LFSSGSFHFSFTLMPLLATLAAQSLPKWPGTTLSAPPPPPSGRWETNWPAGDKMMAKVIYDRAAGEVRVLLHKGDKTQQKTFVIEQDLATTMQEAGLTGVPSLQNPFCRKFCDCLKPAGAYDTVEWAMGKELRQCPPT
jgi:hypothetical protein